MIDIFLCRHGRTDANVNRQYQGQTDNPLNGAGRNDAQQTAQMLKSLYDDGTIPEIDKIFSSPLIRAHDTAKTIAETLGGVSVDTDPRLMEMNLGLYEGYTSKQFYEMKFTLNTGEVVTGKELRRRHKSGDPRYQHIRHGSIGDEAENAAETKQQVCERVTRALIEKIDAIKSVIVVFHNIAYRAFMAEVDSEQAEKTLGHTDVVHIRYNPFERIFTFVKRYTAP